MTSNIVSHKLTRRTFLKATAATAAVVAVGDKLFGGPMSTLVESAAAAPVTEDKWIPTCCWHCSQACPTLAHRVNGVVIKIEGNPDSTANRGKLCARGNASIMRLYNPWVVKTPMKRTNPVRARKNPDTGEWEIPDPGWVEISWEEALNTVATKLKTIRADNPAKYVHMESWNMYTNITGPGPDPTPFPLAFGSPNKITSYGGIQCGAAHHFVAWLMERKSVFSKDNARCKWSIEVGGDLNKCGVPGVRKWIEKRRGTGVKSICADPRYSITAMKADEWMPIRVGTGASLAALLAMYNIIVNDLKIYDVEFLKKRCNAPYLIGPDGHYVRASEPLIEDPVYKKIKQGKPLIWDPVDGKAKMWDDETIKDFALEGTYTVNGVECQPAFQLMKDYVKQWTPEKAAEISDIPAETLRRWSQEFVDAAQIGSTIVIDGVELPYRPAMVTSKFFSSRMRYLQSMLLHMGLLLNMLVGNLGAVGGFQMKNNLPNPVDGVVMPGGHTAHRFKWPPDAYMQDTFWPMAYKAWVYFWFQLLDRKKYHCPYEVEALSVLGANNITTGGSVDTNMEAFTKIPFVFGLAYHFDEPCEMSDILLPEPGWTGRYGYQRRGAGIHQPMLEKPLYDQRQPEDILTELAVRIGFLEDWNTRLNSHLRLRGENKLDTKTRYTWEEVFDRYLKRLFGAEYGLEWFKVHGVKEAPPKPGYKAYGYYTNPKARYNFYWDYVKWRGEELKRELDAVGVTHPHPEHYDHYHALPSWVESTICDVPPEYDLWSANWKGNVMAMGMTADNPWLQEIMERFDPYVMYIMINTETAAARGIKDGDLVVVESGNSGLKVEGEARVTETIHPKTVAIGGQYGRYSRHMNPFTRLNPHYNRLPSMDSKYMEALSCAFDVGAKVKVYKKV